MNAMSAEEKKARAKAARQARADEQREIAMYSNDSGSDEKPIRPGSRKEKEFFEDYAEMQWKPSDLFGVSAECEATRQRYAQFLADT